VRAMFIGAIGCNLAWGIIDAAFYLIACLTEHGRHALLLRSVQQAADPARARQTVAESLPPKVVEALEDADLDRIQSHLKQLPAPAERPRLTGEDWRGAAGVFLLVFLSTLPVVVPFMFMREIEAPWWPQHFSILPFPLQNALTRPLRAAAAKQGRAEFLSLWAGQGVRMSRRMKAADLVATLVRETEAAIASLQRSANDSKAPNDPNVSNA